MSLRRAAVFHCANRRRANPGTLTKPFATLQRAQKAVRQKRGGIFLRGRTYYLPETLVFTAEDFSTKTAPVARAESVLSAIQRLRAVRCLMIIKTT